MAAELLRLEIATPSGLALTTDCESIAAPSVSGEFGVFPGHLPLLAALRTGVITYQVEGRPRYAAVGPGFVEAGPEKVLLLTDTFAEPEDIDTAEVSDELSAAEKRLTELTDEYSGHAYNEIVREIDWAEARLDAAKRAEP